MSCNCDLTNTELETCCLPIIEGERRAQSPLELMRARYTAFTLDKIEFIESSHDPKTLHDFDLEATKEWSDESQWLGLKILDYDDVSPQETDGQVEFVATYKNSEGRFEHHEISTFKKRKGDWFFSNGAVQGQESYVRDEPKIGRNDPCPCGSGKKHKKCCLNL